MFHIAIFNFLETVLFYLFIDNQAKKNEIKDKLLVVISITTCVDQCNLT